MKSRNAWVIAVLVCCALTGALTACEEVRDAIKEAAGKDGVWCLDELLKMAGLTREDLGKDADKLIADALSAQEDLLGESYVIDCEAKDKNGDLTKPGASSGGEGVPPVQEGETLVAPSAEDVPGQIGKIQDTRGGAGEDVAILLDATGSMGDDQAAVAENIDSIMAAVAANEGRLAVAWYKDNMECDSPWYQSNASGLVDMTGITSEIKAFVNSIYADGGCDWPESLYDAVWETATKLQWESLTRRMIIVITDAPPLEGSLTVHTKEQVVAKTAELGITIHTITVGVSY
ncbi:MAG: VWA domain-containing protein [Deltaproteobacteria bacterium]|nr:VWA domain-containing protein [Deltaproteobacteria bacterium]